MVKHRGEILKKAIEQSGKEVKQLAKETKISRSTLYKAFEDPDPRLEYVFKIGKALNIDFSKDFPELSTNTTKESEENLTYKIKYMELAEKIIQVMEEREEYRKELEDLKNQIGKKSA
jgi:predicted transcriptional regulator